MQTDVRKIITRIACRFLRGIFVKSDRLLASDEPDAHCNIVIKTEFFQLAHQIDPIPEVYAIEILAANRADQSLDEGMRHWNVSAYFTPT